MDGSNGGGFASWLSILFWVFFLVSVVAPMLQQRMLIFERLKLMQLIERKRRTRVITLIHRQETMSILGFPIVRFINIEDSEAILQAIRLTPPDVPIDLILHTPGGLVLAAEQIACAIQKRPGRVTVMVPHYAMSGGTLVALAADEIRMDANAVLGPVDPQVGEYPAASILAAAEQENPNRDDRTLILADVSRKAIRQVHQTVKCLLREKMPEEKAEAIAEVLSSGTWTHDYPIQVEEAHALGLPVSEGLPTEVYELMRLYPQPAQRRPSVEYVPVPYHPQPAPGAGGERRTVPGPPRKR
ncbi:MAG: hypothetical protein HY321_04165 [Armatimonadetes bacterium]|nr:hypothetical protein [Armatimonadota bacterium]